MLTGDPRMDAVLERELARLPEVQTVAIVEFDETTWCIVRGQSPQGWITFVLEVLRAGSGAADGLLREGWDLNWYLRRDGEFALALVRDEEDPQRVHIYAGWPAYVVG